MESVQLGSSSLYVPRVGVGCGPMGVHDYGRVDPAELSRVIDEALACGLVFFDTADIYGLGYAEEFLGRNLGERRHRAVIATKGGVRRTADGRVYYDTSADWLNTALENSLCRLRTDYIDLYQVHYLDGHTPAEEIACQLEGFRQAGRIRAYGFCNTSLRDISCVESGVGFASVQNEFSLACRNSEEEIEKLKSELGVTFIAYGVLGQGILTGKYSRSSLFDENDRRRKESYTNFHGIGIERNLSLLEHMKETARRCGRSCAQIAIRWVLEYCPGSVALVGIKSRRQLQDSLSALTWHLGADEMVSLSRASAEIHLP